MLGQTSRARGRPDRVMMTSFSGGNLLQQPARRTATGQCRVHPRACGGNDHSRLASVIFCGPSPRVRGKLSCRSEVARHVRSIPARAGETGCNGRVVLARTLLIRPPTAQFTFTDLHGLDWEGVRDAPTFGDLWPTLRAWIDDAEFLAAHNAAFDRSVLFACCARYRLRAPRIPFLCTVQLARVQWGIRPTKLPDVCQQLRILLRHHDARSDAEACARIVLAAQPRPTGVDQECAERTGRRPAPWSAWLPHRPGTVDEPAARAGGRPPSSAVVAATRTRT